jgi:hypothetical protein
MTVIRRDLVVVRIYIACGGSGHQQPLIGEEISRYNRITRGEGSPSIVITLQED